MQNQKVKPGDSRLHIIESPVHQDTFLDTIRTKLVVSATKKHGETIVFSSEVKRLDQVKAWISKINLSVDSVLILPPGFLIEKSINMKVKAHHAESNGLLPTVDGANVNLFSLTNVYFIKLQRSTIEEQVLEENSDHLINDSNVSSMKVFRIGYKKALLFEEEKTTKFLANLNEVTFSVEEVASLV